MKIEVIFQILVHGACLYVRNEATHKVNRNNGYIIINQNHLQKCKSYTDILRLMEDTHRDLNNLHTNSTNNDMKTNIARSHRRLNNRAAQWIRKFQSQLLRIEKLCNLTEPLDHILEKQHNVMNPSSTRSQLTRKYFPCVRDSNTLGNFHKRNYKMRVSVLASELLRVVSRSRGATVPEGETKTLLLKVLRLKQQKPSTLHLQDTGAWNRVSSVTVRSVVEVGVKEAVREVPPTFLSVALGPRLIQHNWFNFNLSSPLVLTLTRALAPAILRMGGSAANFLTYDPTLQDFSPHRRDNSVSSFSRDDLGPVQAPQRPPPAAIAPQNVELVREVTGGGVSVESSLHTTTQRAPQPDHTSQNNTHDTKHSDRILPTHHTHHSSSTPHTRLSNLSHRTRHENFTHKEINSLSTDDRHSENKGRGNLFPTDFNSHSNSPSNQSNQDPITSQPRCYPRDVAECSCKTDYGTPTFTNFTMSGTDWRKLTDFAETVGMRLLFDLNQFYRDEDGGWNPSNARLLMRDAAARGAHILWQLGNEPNAYKHKFGFSITGQRSAQDYDQLQEELSHYFLPGHSLPIVGPDVTRPKRRGYTDKLSDGLRTFSVDFLREFLSNTRTNLTAVTWHQYYMNGRTAGVKDFLSPDVLDQLVWQVAQMVTVRNQLALGAPLWLTETGSAWGGGARGLSNAYVAGFMWLDKLGVAARGGVDLVARQTLYEGCYAMIDNNLVPNPDYWLSVLYKRLVGGRVLNASLSQAPITTRLYAHCHNNYSHDYTPGGVVIYGMNLANESSQVALTHHLAHSPILQYLLLPSDGVLQSRSVLLNGRLLQVTPDGKFSELTPLPLPPGLLHLPPTSLGFWVLPHAHALACM